MKAQLLDELLAYRLRDRGLIVTFGQARTLRRMESQLRRWHELQCGVDCGGRGTQCVEQSDDTGAWYKVIRLDSGIVKREPMPDIRHRAESAINDLCEEIGAHYYIQTDPRGAALWVDSRPIPRDSHTGAVCCCIS